MFSSLLLLAQEKPARPPAINTFPDSDFTLRDHGVRPQKGRVVLGPMESDGKGGTKGSFAVYGGASMIQVESLSFSGDGKMLAVGSTPGHGDVWDIEKRTKLFSLDGGITVALSPDGRLLAKDENGIEICDAAMGKPIKRIPWSIATSTPGGQFSRDGTVFVGGGGKRLIAWSTNGVWDTSGKQYCHKEGLGTRLPSE